MDITPFEKHYRIGELARIWGIGKETVRKILLCEPGVIRIRMGRKKTIPFTVSLNLWCAGYTLACSIFFNSGRR